MQNTPNELTRPRTIPALAAYLRERGETISAATLYRWARSGHLPTAKVGKMTSTAAAYYAVRTPEVSK